jgi:hypothetical protein
MSNAKSQHESFVAELPELLIMAKARFRHLDPEARDEAIQNVTSLTWKYWVRLCQKGRGHEEGLLGSVWWYACKQHRVGRTIQSSGRPGRGTLDAYAAARRGGAAVEHADFNLLIGDATPVPDQVAFRLDMPRFLGRLTDKQRAIALKLAEGHRTGEIAKELGVTPAVISQCKARFKELYDEFFAEAA